jgi:formate hydrogenlyase transcriptional activator
MDALCAYDWPGNIRELQNFIERAVLLTAGPVLEPPLEDLAPALPAATPSIAELRAPATDHTLVAMERAHIAETLRRTNWVVGGRAGAAAKLGLPRTTLISRMRKLGIFRENPWQSGLGSSAGLPVPQTVQPGQFREAEQAFAYR